MNTKDMPPGIRKRNKRAQRKILRALIYTRSRHQFHKSLCIFFRNTPYKKDMCAIPDAVMIHAEMLAMDIDKAWQYKTTN